MFQPTVLRLLLPFVAGLCALPSLAAALDLKDPKVRESYAVGASIGANLKSQGVDVDPAAVAAGIADAMAGKTALSDAELKAAMETVRGEVQAKQHAKMQSESAANTKAGTEFLAENAKKPGVKTTASGLQYKVLKPGTGRTPSLHDTVKVNYKGSLIDGTVFDSSIARGEPVTFPVNGVIAGWTEALQMMKEGAEWEVYVPANLAYGERGAGGVIGPNSVLIFDIQLIDIEK
jgi:FKBP-type peptidyl-prolyl cis-trans isomerase FklB